MDTVYVDIGPDLDTNKLNKKVSYYEDASMY